MSFAPPGFSQINLLIIVPTLNSYQLLPRLVSSLKQQTFTSWQLLFIDGSSSSEHIAYLNECCASDSRIHWVNQASHYHGIFGAMNQGFDLSMSEPFKSDYILFWGSDDWAFSSTSLFDTFNSLDLSSVLPDMIFTKGQYVSNKSSQTGRITSFSKRKFIDLSNFRRYLLFGYTPPHQATFFSVHSVFNFLRYSPDFSLSADLDYFLRVSKLNLDLDQQAPFLIQFVNLITVYISDGGVSAQYSKRRFNEVRKAYTASFSHLWWLPFILRYFRRLLSLF
ncbi:glycosyltransferase [Synechococcus sp. MIT S9451]|uniref:glycosyltransferase n=1 Tax=Synechococcus sp. MIT S9451 TaxID=3082543 RepID=UPI0039B48DEF